MPVKQFAYRCLSKASAIMGKTPEQKSGLRVLMYHAVGTPLAKDPYGNSISVELFKEHIRQLVSLRGTWEPSVFCRPSSARLQVSVTFDDGYKDTLKIVAPILENSNIPFTLFATSKYIQNDYQPYLNAADLKKLAERPGVLIGAHGKNHVRMDELDNASLKKELADSRKYLEDIIGRPVTALSYPHGAVTRRVRDAAQEAGYILGGTSRYGLNKADRDPLLLCRNEITAWDQVEDLRLKIFGHWDWYESRHPDPASPQSPS